jgi:hypothetical protein
MSNILYRQNMTTWAFFSDTPGQWIYRTPEMSSVNPDMCIVRGITFLGPQAVEKTYAIWCSLTNDYIGSCNGTCTVSQSQGMQIELNSPVPNSLTFQLHVINTVANTLTLDPLANGNIIIHLEFIKYRNTPPHA